MPTYPHVTLACFDCKRVGSVPASDSVFLCPDNTELLLGPILHGSDFWSVQAPSRVAFSGECVSPTTADKRNGETDLKCHTRKRRTESQRGCTRQCARHATVSVVILTHHFQKFLHSKFKSQSQLEHDQRRRPFQNWF